MPDGEVHRVGGEDEGPRASLKPIRVLACVLCRQRKVKCDRRFPCANCTRARVQCVQANPLTARQRRRRFPELELLERVRVYESLLRQHNINFESTHSPNGTAERWSPSEDGQGSPTSTDNAHYELSRDRATFSSKEPVDLWDAISRVVRHPGLTATLEPADGDESGDGDTYGYGDNKEDNDFPYTRRRHPASRTVSFKHARQQILASKASIQINDHLLFGPPQANIDISSFHPKQADFFRLWQIYLDNVNPLLRVTHTPTLQPQIIDAASNIANISPELEALIFSIYCVSIMSITEGECQKLFATAQKSLLELYQFACQQALFKCGAWHTGDVNGLTATYLYLISVRRQLDARSLSSMLAITMRTAQRIGIHNESSYSGRSTFDSEIRRRLWWSLVTFDHRICELSNYKTTTLDPTWNCNTPLNANDFEIRPDMKTPPACHEKPTEALFTVVRNDLSDFIRHSTFHLAFVNPSLSSIAQPKVARLNMNIEGGELIALEGLIEEKYFSYCNADDPLHYMTIWTTRAFLAKNKLLEHYSRHSTASARPAEPQRKAALSYAVSMLECDTRLRSSPLTTPYMWHVNTHFPLLGYVHILNALKKRPADDLADRAWAAINDNYATIAGAPDGRESDDQGGSYYVIALFSRSDSIIGAWEARETFLEQNQLAAESPPRILSDLYSKLAETDSAMVGEPSNRTTSSNGVAHRGGVDTFAGQPAGLVGDQNSIGGPPYSVPERTGFQPAMSNQASLDVNMDQIWTEVDWTMLHVKGW